MKRFGRNLIPMGIAGGITALLLILGVAGKWLSNIGTFFLGFLKANWTYVVVILITWVVAVTLCTLIENIHDKKEAEKRAQEEEERRKREKDKKRSGGSAPAETK